jgi:N-acetylgalactosamine PTS system EIIA component
MIGFILTGHGHFAEGLSSAMEVVLGKQEWFINVNFPKEDTSFQLEEKMSEAINKLKGCENIIVFADLLSGSPFNAAIMKAIVNDRIKVIYGVNFGMLIEAVINRDAGMELDEMIKNAIDTGKNQIGVFEGSKVKDEDVDEDEL